MNRDELAGIALADQLEAAAREARRIILAAAVLTGMRPTEGAWSSQDMPAILAGCRHLESPTVAVVLLQLAGPMRAACPTCCGVMLGVDQAPGRCDVCAAPTEWFHEVTLQLGAVLFVGNVCSPCRDMGEADPRSMLATRASRP